MGRWGSWGDPREFPGVNRKSHTFVSDISCSCSGFNPCDGFFDFFIVALPLGTDGSKCFAFHPHFLYFECIFFISHATDNTLKFVFNVFIMCSNEYSYVKLNGFMRNVVDYDPF